jgi:D-galactarolactone cycloisomerase
MKIVRVEVHPAEAKLKEPFGWSQRWTDRRGMNVIKAVTDDGLTGWGESGASAPVREALAAFAQSLIGTDPFQREAHWQRMFQTVYQSHGFAGPAVIAMSGLDMAMHDLCGKALGRPASDLLGGALRDRVAVYATGLYYREGDLRLGARRASGPLLQEAQEYVRRGFTGMKMKVGGKPVAEDIERVHAVRQAIGPDVRLMVDANEAYNAPTAIQVARHISGADISWFEEPCPSYDDNANLEVRRASPIPISGGEGLKTRLEFAPRLAKGVFDIIQPDVVICGGVTELRRIGLMANAFGTTVNPHFWGTGISFAASLHVVATLPPTHPAVNTEPYVNEPVLEYDQTPHSLREHLTPPFTLKDGFVPVPSGPGLGIEVDEKALRRFTLGQPVVVK